MAFTGIIGLAIVAFILLVVVAAAAVAMASVKRKGDGKPNPDSSSNSGLVITIILLVIVGVLVCGGVLVAVFGLFWVSNASSIQQQNAVMESVQESDAYSSPPTITETPLPEPVPAASPEQSVDDDVQP